MGTRRQSSATALLVAGITLLACTAELSQPKGSATGTGSQGTAATGASPAMGAGGTGGASTGGSGGTGVTGGVSGSGATSAGAPPVGTAGAPPVEPTVFSRPGLAARLSKFEYQYSIADVLGVTLLPTELDAAAGGIPDDTGDGVFK